MHAIHSLVLDRGRPPTIHQHDLIGADEVEADAADGEGGEHDFAVRVGVEGGERGVAGGGFEGAVDAGDVCVAEGGEAGLEDVEEGGPLGEDDCFCLGVFLLGGGEDGEEGFDLAGADVWVDVRFFSAGRFA